MQEDMSISLPELSMGMSGDYVQAIGYRHELTKYVGSAVQVLLVGGGRSADFPTGNREPDVEERIFGQIISTARRQIEWLLRTESS